MNLLKQIKGLVAGLIFLVVGSLLMEQLVYLLFSPGYWWTLVESPVFWSLFSVGCFYQLWLLDQKFPEQYSDEGSKIQDDEQPMNETNPATGLPMAGALDIAGNPYGGDDSVRFDLI
ncbi:hypothetical protein [Endozoicomonas lisbonensis]|uniref:Uncharacterized protein n=1 Tax=Endozoicomonas lisbonensis TaxID=3120522 RepID=A0ABV2SNP7_9GAMM